MKNAAIAAAVLIVAGCVTGSTHQEKDKGGPRIEIGVGHFNRDGKPFHYWDKEKEIPAVCARCHAAEGVPQYLREGRNTPAQHVKNAFACTNCHASMVSYERHKVEKVTFASGLSVDSGDNNSNLCMTCHQGRESTASVNKAIADMDADTPNPKLGFIHVHYFPAGATMYGTEAKVGYEYPGKTYVGRFTHPLGLNTCTSCHEPHTGELQAQKCATCHVSGGRPEARASSVAKSKADLYAGIQQYARTVGGMSIAFSPAAFPYWYADTNGNGKVDPEELKPSNGYKAYTPRLVQATYNYTFLLRDPGAGYHNGRYAQQLAYDTLESLAASGKSGVSMAGRRRP